MPCPEGLTRQEMLVIGVHTLSKINKKIMNIINKYIKFLFVFFAIILFIEIVYYIFIPQFQKNQNQINQSPKPETSVSKKEIFIGDNFVGLSKNKINELLSNKNLKNKVILPVTPTEQTKILFFKPTAKNNTSAYIFITNFAKNTIIVPSNQTIWMRKLAQKPYAAMIMEKQFDISFRTHPEDVEKKLGANIEPGNLGRVIYSNLPEYTPELTPLGNLEGVTGIKGKYVYFVIPLPRQKPNNVILDENFYFNQVFLKYNNRYVFLAE